MRKKDRYLRDKYEKHYGKIDENKEIHHIIPVFAGGTDDMDNLTDLTTEEHMNAHYTRWKEFGDFRDLCSYYMIGYNFSEAHKTSSSEGGKKGGKKVKELKIGICTEDKEKRRKWASMGGKVGGKVQKEKKIGIHAASKEQNKIWASMGGKKGAFTKSEIQKELGRRGGAKNKGSVWITDGLKSRKYTTSMQRDISIERFLEENTEWTKGRTLVNSKTKNNK